MRIEKILVVENGGVDVVTTLSQHAFLVQNNETCDYPECVLSLERVGELIKDPDMEKPIVDLLIEVELSCIEHKVEYVWFYSIGLMYEI